MNRPPQEIMSQFQAVKGITIAKWAALAIVLYFILRQVAIHWRAVTNVGAPNWEWITAGSVLGVMGWVTNICVYRCLVRSHGFEMSIKRVAGLYLFPMLGKYIPGKIWSVVGGVWLLAREGIPNSVALTIIGLSTALGFTAATIVCLAGGLMRDHSWATQTSIASAMGIVLISLHPKVFYPTINWILRCCRRNEIASTLSVTTLLRLLVGRVVGWVLFGLGFYCIVQSFDTISLKLAPEIISVFVFAQVAGIAVLFAPAGLGVREGVVIFGLTNIVGPGTAIVVAAVGRLWLTATELALTALAYIALRLSISRTRQNSFKGIESRDAGRSDD